LPVLALFSFRDSWDQFLWPLVVVSRDEFRTYPSGSCASATTTGTRHGQMAIGVSPHSRLPLVPRAPARAAEGFDLSALKG